MQFQVGEILSVPLFAHTRYFFVYFDDGETVGWGPWDGISWMGGKGHVERKVLLKVETEYKWLSDNGEAQDINLEKRTGANQQFIAVPERMRYTFPEGTLGVHRFGKLTCTSSE